MTYTILDVYRVTDVVVYTLQFELPLHYPSTAPTIPVVARLVLKHTASRDQPSARPDAPSLPSSLANADIIVYLQGGPGFPCAPVLSNTGLTKELVGRGFGVLYLDQRGTGLSNPLEADLLLNHYLKNPTVSEQLAYLKHFRADSIVNDCEAIRQSLGVSRWSLLGQSFGGFCSLTYLSLFPGLIKQLLITGGIPPLHVLVDEVYAQTYDRTTERNERYYAKYPEDVVRVQQICRYLSSTRVVLPGGGNLSVERFQLLGLMFGGAGGTDKLHQMVFHLSHDLTLRGTPTRAALAAIEAAHSFDSNVLYALFQEAIYMDSAFLSVASNWSAERLRAGRYVYTEGEPVYFTGEMVYKSMFDDYVELRKLKPLAEAIHQHVHWGPLYDVAVLRLLTSDAVPVVAATYVNDQYVDFALSMKAKGMVGGMKQYITSEFFHGGLRDDPKKVLDSLFALVGDEIM